MKTFFLKLKSRISLFISQFYMAPYCVPAWGWAEHWAILRCIMTGRIINGPDKEKLYFAVGQITGKKYIIGFDSGSDAIYAALTSRNIGKKNKVILPSYCCESVVKAIARTGATPVFCDITDEYNPDVNHILTLIDPYVRAIVFPHLFGNPASIDEMEEALIKNGIRSQILLIDDAAQSFGARLNGRLVGTFGDVGIISFGPGKTMIASGGGLLLTNSLEMASLLQQTASKKQPTSPKIRSLMYYLIFRRWRHFTLPFYFMVSKFFRGHCTKPENALSLCNIDAAIALAQLDKLETMLQIRLDRKKQLDSCLSRNFSGRVDILSENIRPDKKLNVATKYVFRLKSNNNHNLQSLYRQLLLRNSIELFDLYSPLHMNNSCGESRPSLPITEKCCDQLLQIPIEPSISDRDFKNIISAIPDLSKIY